MRTADDDGGGSTSVSVNASEEHGTGKSSGGNAAKRHGFHCTWGYTLLACLWWGWFVVQIVLVPLDVNGATPEFSSLAWAIIFTGETVWVWTWAAMACCGKHRLEMYNKHTKGNGAWALSFSPYTLFISGIAFGLAAALNWWFFADRDSLSVANPYQYGNGITSIMYLATVPPLVYVMYGIRAASIAVFDCASKCHCCGGMMFKKRKTRRSKQQQQQQQGNNGEAREDTVTGKAGYINDDDSDDDSEDDEDEDDDDEEERSPTLSSSKRESNPKKKKKKGNGSGGGGGKAKKKKTKTHV